MYVGTYIAACLDFATPSALYLVTQSGEENFDQGPACSEKLPFGFFLSLDFDREQG
jgi:hypothetical protein